MLIKLVPAAPHPSVLFSLTFQNFEDSIPNPISWTCQLNYLAQDDLEMPSTMHSLDKAAVIPSLLEEVTFDVPTLTVSCLFADGAVEEWPLMGAGLLEALENIVIDVDESTLETEREAEREKAKQREKDRKRMESLNSPPPAKVARHKRQRSLLMTLVASIVPLASSSLLSTSPRAPTPPPPPPPPPLPPPPSDICPRALRRRARSALVDTFRQHVLTELTRRFPSGGYYTWIIQSMLRRAKGRMAQLVEQAGGCVPDLVPSYPEDNDYFPRTIIPPSPSPFYSDDDDIEGSDDTDTDGSSVHTPSSSHFNNRGQIKYPPPYPHSQSCSSHSTGSPQHLSPQEVAEYKDLATMTVRLHELLRLADARQVQSEMENQQRDEVLEIRSRRRAWLNRALVGGIRRESIDIGLAMPFRSSPLAQYSWSSNDADSLVEEQCEERFVEDPYDAFEDRMGLGLRRTRGMNDARLFPVSEEDEDDARELELELGFGLDLEGGMGWPEEDEVGMGGFRVAFEMEKPRPRMRTSSMHKHRPNVQSPADMGFISAPRPQQLNSSSILCQPLSVGKPHELIVDLQGPRVHSEADDSIRDLEFTSYGECERYGDEEFTLAMDLPFTVRAQDRVFGRGKSVDAAMDHDHEWMTPSLSPVNAVDY